MTQLTPLWLLKYLPNMLACHVTIIHELKGPSNTITCADASSHLAIGEAFRTIQRGNADLAICGGAESKVIPMGLLRQICSSGSTKRTTIRPARRSARSTPTPREPPSRRRRAVDPGRISNTPKRAARRSMPNSSASPPARIPTASPSPTPAATATPRRSARRLTDAGLTADDVDLLIPNGLGIPRTTAPNWPACTTRFGDRLADSADVADQSPDRQPRRRLRRRCGRGGPVAASRQNSRRGQHAKADGCESSSTCAPETRDAKIDVAVSSVYSLGGQNAALVFQASLIWHEEICMNRVVITGMGWVTPMGHSIEIGLEAAAGRRIRHCATRRSSTPATFPTSISAEVKDYRLADFIGDVGPHAGAGRNTQFALAACAQAWKAAGPRCNASSISIASASISAAAKVRSILTPITTAALSAWKTETQRASTR